MPARRLLLALVAGAGIAGLLGIVDFNSQLVAQDAMRRHPFRARGRRVWQGRAAPDARAEARARPVCPGIDACHRGRRNVFLLPGFGDLHVHAGGLRRTRRPRMRTSCGSRTA